ncbi:MAG TPA: NIPSNAP family protein [Longimicrobiaceae bacterium]
MNRRDFLSASAVAGLAPFGGISAAAARQDERQYFEIRRYQAIPGPKQRAMGRFLGEVAIPAMNRAGVGPVGAFTVTYGENRPTIILLLVHPTLESVVTLRERLMADSEYRQAGAEVLDAPLGDPAFVRVESSLLRAFADMPRLEAPATAAERSPRIFELRRYESHNDAAALRKIEMFNERGGEIKIFRRTGLTPVFFGETVIGPRMPNLTYMLTFPDMAARDAAWSTFQNDPEWRRLSGDSYFADTVSNITDEILRPTQYSQI